MPTSRMKSTSTTVVRRISRLNRRSPCSNSVSGARAASRTAMSPNIVFGARGRRQRRARAADDRRAEEHQVRRVGSRSRSRGGRRRHACRPAATRRSASIAEPRDRATRAAARRPAPDRRPRAGTRSPGTTFRSGVSCQRPSRSTVAVGDHRRAQPLGRLLRPIRLPEVDRDAEHDHRHDDQRIDALAERADNRARDEQNDDERIREEVQRAARAPRDGGREPARSARTARGAAPPRRRSVRVHCSSVPSSVIELDVFQLTMPKCSFTFATICGSVSLSTVSISTVHPVNAFDRLRRFLQFQFGLTRPEDEDERQAVPSG